MAVLALSSADDVAAWLQLPVNRTVDERERDSARIASGLQAAREWITGNVTVPASTAVADIPQSLHLACTLLASRWVSRADSIYGIEAFSLGGESGGVLTNDPDIRRLLGPYRRQFGIFPPLAEAVTPAPASVP